MIGMKFIMDCIICCCGSVIFGEPCGRIILRLQQLERRRP